MLHAVLLLGVLGSVAVFGVQQYVKRRAVSSQESFGNSTEDVKSNKEDTIQAHALLDLDTELEMDSPDETGGYCFKEKPPPPPVYFYALVKPKQMAPIPEEPELEVDLTCLEKGSQAAIKPLSPSSFERLYETLWTGLKKQAL